MNIRNISIAIFALSIFAGCGTKKSVTEQSSTKKQPITTTQSSEKKQRLQFVQKVADRALYQRNLVADLSFTLNNGSKNISVPGILRMRKDEVVRIQLLVPIIRSEVGRIEFTKNYVLFIDRMHKQYVKASYNEVAFLKDNGINFYTLQALFWNQLFIPGKQRVGENQLETFNVNLTTVQSPNQAYVPITLKDGRMDYKWMAESFSGLIGKAEVKYTSTEHGISTLNWQYDNFQNFGSKKFPTEQEVIIRTQATKQRKTLKAKFSLSGLNDNANWESITQPSNKYRKVGIEEILEKLTAL